MADMTPAPISVERLCELLAVMTGSDPNRMTDFPGGCDCHECGCVFIGGDGHEYCAQCEAKRQLLAALPEALPALLHQLAEMSADLEREQGVREDAQRQLRAAERAREEAERDALRYRWVRACDRKGELAIHVDTMCEGELLGMEQLDAAIDAFLAASGGA